MRNLKLYKKVLLVIFASVLAVTIAGYIKVMFTVPGELTLINGENYVYDFKSFFPIKFIADKVDLIKLDNQIAQSTSGSLGFQKPVSITPCKNGTVNLNVKFFGLLTVKSVRVDIVSNKQLVACGCTVGVKMDIDGILVIGVSDVETKDGKKVLPSKDSGIKPGCFITAINGKSVSKITELVKEIDSSGGKPLSVEYRSGASSNRTYVIPVLASDDKKYHIGLWVRDSTAGIGTLTFYDPETLEFGALGHGITDIDTGTLLPSASGDLVESSILGIKKGTNGNPGELKGVFIEDTKLGSIDKNSEFGIYGDLSRDTVSKLKGKIYQIGLRAEIKEGPATILSNIDGKNVEEYTIEIQKVSRQNINGSKGMIIKVTDERLLNATGGIVQGMSGSPILQNGKIIGAVTHVLVNDPTKGYGIFIEGMLRNLTNTGVSELKKAG